MKQLTVYAVALSVSLIFAGTAASAEQTVIPNGSRPSKTASSSQFTGNVRHEPVFPATEEAPFSVSYVTFEPGARTFWHTHPAGQRLIVVSGQGLTGTWDGKVVTVNPGDAVWCPPDIKHWHGATSTSAMTHIAITGMKDGKNVTWLEAVTDEQYQAK